MQIIPYMVEATISRHDHTARLNRATEGSECCKVPLGSVTYPISFEKRGSTVRLIIRQQVVCRYYNRKLISQSRKVRCLDHVFHPIYHYSRDVLATNIIGARRDDLEGLAKAHIGNKNNGIC